MKKNIRKVTAVLLGLLGMIIAVPCAAIIGVLLKYLIKNYKQSPMYLEN